MTCSNHLARFNSRLPLLAAALISVAVGVGCSEEEEEIHPQLEYRQRVLAEWIDNPGFDLATATANFDCTVRLSPVDPTGPIGDDANIRAAVAAAESWDVICLEPGTYNMGTHDGTPSIGTVTITSTANLTIKGIGEEVDDVVLDFDGQVNSKGFNVSTPGFWIENMWIKNTKDNGVEVKATNTRDNPNVFRKLKVSWDAGSVTENGAYAIYPTRSSYVIAEYNEVVGASDAGLYVGQVEHGIVRFNFVHGNVAGLEVENSFDVEVLGNAVTDNTGGILALQEDGLTRLTNESVLIQGNQVWANNRPNFAVPGSTVANVQTGTGLMAFAGTNIEFRDNTVFENDSTGLLIVSNVLLDQLDGDEAPYIYSEGYDPYPTRIYNNGNTYTDNGLSPTLLISVLVGGPPAEDVLWDGLISDGESAGHQVDVEIPGPGEDPVPVIEPVPEVFDPEICIGSEDVPSFFILFDDPKHEDLDFECDLEELDDTLFP